jgi:hypothetical protein
VGGCTGRCLNRAWGFSLFFSLSCSFGVLAIPSFLFSLLGLGERRWMDDSTVLTDRQGVEEFTYLLLCRRLCFSFAHSRMMLLRYRLCCYGSNRSTLLRDLVSFFVLNTSTL